MKNVIVSMFLVATVGLLPMANLETEPVKNVKNGGGSTVSVMSIQKEWKFRLYEGRVQKRLWSISENKWLTEWLDK